MKFSGLSRCVLATLLMAVVMLLSSCRYRVRGREHMTPESGHERPQSEVSYDNTEVSPSDDGLEIPVMKNSRGQLLRRTGYTTQYNSGTRCPDWTAWHLTAAHTSGPNKRQHAEYQEDMQVPEPRATRMDYMQKPYDRGHMCPAGDNKWSQQAMADCFLYTNMCPQNHNMNSGEWNDLEMKCRSWAQKFGDIYIVCGPVYDSAAPARYMGKNKIRVPDGFFKAVLCTQGKAKAIGFYYRNENTGGSIEDHAMSVRRLEQMTGIDFFPRLDRAVQDEIETRYDYADWR